MLSPKRTKFRKAHKGRIHGLAKSGTTLSFGNFGLKALEPERITARQIEAARRAVTRAMKRAGRVWIRIFPDIPVSTKPAELRMGSGKLKKGIYFHCSIRTCYLTSYFESEECFCEMKYFFDFQFY